MAEGLAHNGLTADEAESMCGEFNSPILPPGASQDGLDMRRGACLAGFKDARSYEQ